MTETPKFVAPVEVPDDIGEGIDFFGVPGGVEGGVPGGVLGGIVGGLPDAPAAPPPKAKPVRVGGNIKAPRKVKDVSPVYPDIAKQARVQGIVILEAIIDPAGNVTNVRVLRSIPLLDQSAMAAVKQWKYEPTMLNGVPVPIVMTVTVNFALQ
jgi:protein TonB